MNRKKIKEIMGNIVYAFLVQGLSLMLSVIMSLVLPKILGVKEYAYWQLFLFYISYVGFFHFGINDGIYLRSAGKKIDNLNIKLINSQFWYSILAQTVLGCVLIIASFLTLNEKNRILVIIFTMVYMVLTNAANFLGYLFQALNEVKTYSTSILVDKSLFLIILLIQLLFKVKNFKILIVSYCFSRMCSLIYCCIKGKVVIKSGLLKLRNTVNEIKINISVGCKLMFSTICSMLVLGIGRIVVDSKFGIEAFGIFSFSFSIINFFLQFIAQVSMVLFPALKQIDEKKLKQIYVSGNTLLTFVLSLLLFLYIPVSMLVSWWLPQYSLSLRYLILLLPICIYDGKMNILYMTLFKVLRKEKKLLYINVIALVINIVFSIISAYIYNNIYFVVCGMVCAIAIRNFLSAKYFAEYYEVGYVKESILENLLMCVFVVSTWFLAEGVSLAIYLVMYIVVAAFLKKEIKDSFKMVLE